VTSSEQLGRCQLRSLQVNAALSHCDAYCTSCKTFHDPVILDLAGHQHPSSPDLIEVNPVGFFLRASSFRPCAKHDFEAWQRLLLIHLCVTFHKPVDMLPSLTVMPLSPQQVHLTRKPSNITIPNNQTHKDRKSGLHSASWKCATPLTSQTQPAGPSSGVSSDIIAVDELLSTMKRTLATLSTTFDCLGEQTAKVIDLAPAIGVASDASLPFEFTVSCSHTFANSIYR